MAGHPEPQSPGYNRSLVGAQARCLMLSLDFWGATTWQTII